MLLQAESPKEINPLLYPLDVMLPVVRHHFDHASAIADETSKLIEAFDVSNTFS